MFRLNLTAQRAGASEPSELGAALRACKAAFIGIGVMTAALNVLYLTGSFFMMLIYDRVLPSHSVPTLIGLMVLAGLLFAFQAFLDVIRGRLLVRVGAWLDLALSLRVYDVLIRLPLKNTSGTGLQPLNDLDHLRQFLSSTGPTSLFDLPWMPLYLIICFAFHFWIGVAAMASGVILVALVLLTEMLTQRHLRTAVGYGLRRATLAESSRRNAEVLQAMGMAANVGALWNEANRKYLTAQNEASDVVGVLGALSRVFRLIVQSGMLGLGAYLVIYQQASFGVIIASSILSARALAPLEQVITHWKGFVSARHSWRRLNTLLADLPVESDRITLPKPSNALSVEMASAVPPGSQKVVVRDVSFQLKAGHALGVIGPSASGKSSLGRLLANVWTPAQGKVSLDGGALDQWPAAALGKHIGYLPQDVELFPGTIERNIARFEPTRNSEAVIAAAKAAGVHDVIMAMPDGYETQVGEDGHALSAGQTQRVGLARALYGDPFLVVLDEPTSNLDADGETALTQAILGVRARGGIAVVIAHRPVALAAVNFVLVIAQGKQQAFGPKEAVLRHVLQQPAASGPPTEKLSKGQGVA